MTTDETAAPVGIVTTMTGLFWSLYNGLGTIDWMDVLGAMTMIMGIIASYYTAKVQRQKYLRNQAYDNSSDSKTDNQ